MVHKNPGEPVLRILLFIPTMDVIYAYAITSKQDTEHILKSYIEVTILCFSKKKSSQKSEINTDTSLK